jgi:hypothetical protein
VVEVEAKSLKSAIAHLKGHGTDVLEIPDKAWVEEDNIWESEEYEGADS